MFQFLSKKNFEHSLAQPHVLFVLIALVIGSLYVFINLPLKSPDELAHFYRSYQVSQGDFFADISIHPTGGHLPVSIKAMEERIRKALWPSPHRNLSLQTWQSFCKIPLQPNQTQFVAFNNSAGYPFTLYLSQALAIIAGRGCHLGPFALIYAGRLGNLLLWIILTSLAIRITPVLKWSFFLVGLMPQTIYMASSLSPDTPTNAAAMLFTAVIFHCRISLKLSKKDIAALTLTTLYLLSVKTGYFVLIGLFFLIPKSRFSSNRFYSLFTSIYLVMATAITVAWRSTASGIYLDVPGVSMAEQTAFILNNPFSFLFVFLRTIQHQLLFYIESFAGFLSYFEIRLAAPVLIIYLMVLVSSPFLMPGSQVKLKILNRIWIGLLVTANFVLVLTMLYIWWTPVGDPIIDGPQGRYFIPLAPAGLAVLLPNSGKNKLTPITAALLYGFTTLSINLYAIYRIGVVHLAGH